MISLTLIFVTTAGVAMSEFICPRPCECDGLAVVDCSNRELTRISTDGFDIDTRRIILSNNRVEALEASVFHKTKVRVLQQVLLDHNRISRVDPEAFFAQPELIELDLSHNALTALSMFPFRRCWRLQRLILSHNPLHTFDGVAPPPAFRELYLDHCALRHVLSPKPPAGDVSGVARLRLDGLKRLQVEGNPLRCDCSQLGTYRQLERMRLARDTNCGDSPDLFWQAVLERLDCSPCPQNCTCPTHSVANCSSATLRVVPQEGFNHSVTTIVLSNNSIERIDNGVFAAAKVTATEKILLDHNRLWLLDVGAFSSLDHLRYLDLSHNELRGISNRMLEQASLSNLESLLLSHNLLSHVADGAFSGLSRLRYLDLSHNLLTTLSTDAFAGTALVSISVASNALSDLSWMVNSSGSYRDVNVSNNNLNTLSAAEVAALSRLSALQLVGNPLRCDVTLLPALYALESRALARDTKCHTPPSLRGRFWQNLDRHTAQPLMLGVSSVPKDIKTSNTPPPPQLQQAGCTPLYLFFVIVPITIALSVLLTLAAAHFILKKLDAKHKGVQEDTGDQRLQGTPNEPLTLFNEAPQAGRHTPHRLIYVSQT
ncbi:chondroadherin-like protein [Schistocerca nitens]|uniref:chondroadherin-like protein n=1 Tax=Schistocerca nitens TaxID=7011 RepID=UPI002119172B|nr:chondroadherin-like protein [Schistocerca nitens]